MDTGWKPTAELLTKNCGNLLSIAVCQLAVMLNVQVSSRRKRGLSPFSLAPSAWFSSKVDFALSRVVQSEALSGSNSRFSILSNFQLIDDDVPSLIGVPINGATRTVPLGFNPETQFTAAAQDLLDVLTQSGITDATIGVRGSSVTGFSLTKGTVFGPQSDIDFFIESRQLTDGYTTSKNIPGFVHPNKILTDYPLLRDWSTNWTSTLGRDVTPGVFLPGKLPIQPSIVVKSIVPGG